MDRQTITASAAITRTRLLINGVVQGVGFRPFVYRLATESGLVGHVQNDPHGVIIELEGAPQAIAEFQRRLHAELPPLAKIISITSEPMVANGQSEFQIIATTHDASATTLIPPDIATCDDCLSELFDPEDRRFQYPFINCTNCGPRYTIVKSIPYDRPYTSMSVFPLCPDCQREYDDPSNRRFHAQPNACPICGPHVALHDSSGLLQSGDPIAETLKLLQAGKIVAIRGVGGFHLAVDATHTGAVEELRLRKGRAEKPFALMAPDIETIAKYCGISDAEKALLLQPTRPIVLLRRKNRLGLSESVAPNQNYLGFMLPYTPLHHLLIRGNFDALVMTSGNYSEEPIAIGNDEALTRLASMADYFLLHDRDILQRCDDSIARVQAGQPRITRRSRGHVPLPVFLKAPTARPILAVGGELKNTIALSRGNEVFLSQHIGDLDNPSALAFFEHSIGHLEQIMQITPEIIAFDLHPDYLSSQWAQRQTLPSVSVQHHHAHLASVLAENQFEGKAIGLILDGTGYGTDGTIWGGEVLVGDASAFDRFAWLEPVPMPGGGIAIRHPWRMAAAHLYHAYGEELFDLDLSLLKNHAPEIKLLVQIMQKKLNSPLTSSCGRLFDAVAAMLGFDREIGYEAQAAIELEMLCNVEAVAASSGYADALAQTGAYGALKISPLIKAISRDMITGRPKTAVAADFHRAMVELWLGVAIAARNHYGLTCVALSGGVYQNTVLFETMTRRLHEEKFTTLTHFQVPTNDGGISLGQIAVADAHIRGRRV